MSAPHIDCERHHASHGNDYDAHASYRFVEEP